MTYSERERDFTFAKNRFSKLFPCQNQEKICGAHLRSAERCDMLVPRTTTRFGQRSFPVASPVVWNSLPTHLRSTSVSREQFRDMLKTHLFTQAYAFL